MIHGKNMRTSIFENSFQRTHLVQVYKFPFFVEQIRPFCALTDSSRQRYYPSSGSLRSYCSASLFNLALSYYCANQLAIIASWHKCVTHYVCKNRQKSQMKFSSDFRGSSGARSTEDASLGRPSASLAPLQTKIFLQLRLLISIFSYSGPKKKNSDIPTHNLRGYCLMAIFINSIISVHIIFIMLDAAFFDI